MVMGGTDRLLAMNLPLHSNVRYALKSYVHMIVYGSDFRIVIVSSDLYMKDIAKIN
jgi:hypothetical protein